VHFTDSRLLEAADEADVTVARGEPRRRVAAVVDVLAARGSEPDLRAALASAGELLCADEVDSELALAIAYRAALRMLAAHRSVLADVEAFEAVLEGLPEDDREQIGLSLARVAIPALAVDVEQMKDEGWRYVASYPPEGSEGVDVVGRAASWLTRRLTVDGEAPREAMRRFLALVADEAEIDFPAASATLDRLLARPAAAPARDPLFLALCRTLVEEAVAERGRPF
jgi:hypothetical protein